MTTTETSRREFFGEDVDSWNVDTDGKPGIALFGNAVQVWACQQGRDVSVAEAATAFNCDPRMVIEAVEWHAWMEISRSDGSVDQMMIWHEGE